MEVSNVGDEPGGLTGDRRLVLGKDLIVLRMRGDLGHLGFDRGFLPVTVATVGAGMGMAMIGGTFSCRFTAGEENQAKHSRAARRGRKEARLHDQCE